MSLRWHDEAMPHLRRYRSMKRNFGVALTAISCAIFIFLLGFVIWPSL